MRVIPESKESERTHSTISLPGIGKAIDGVIGLYGTLWNLIKTGMGIKTKIGMG
ncbi:hypothetical protein [Algoriphagus aquimarinus]|uniref:hypothetical protein n=1 Tax=Algoriphagus aquimarinus TaxID=237018 RepID=UPI0030DC20CE|tara:strand:- start:293 stop:454 length:162 start_codon:yes stop_codon:yes gene_type:complete